MVDNEDNNDIYFKQKLMFDPSNSMQPRIIVYGCGSIGSHVIMGLAKTGFNNISAIDYDEVEESNIPAQFYSYKHIGMKKIEAIKDLVKYMHNVDIQIEEIKVDGAYTPGYEQNSVHIICFDNIESRKILVEKLQGFPLLIIDGRIGAFNAEKYSFIGTEEKLYNKYMKTLEGEFSELECGEKTLWSVNAYIASKIIVDVLKFVKNEKNNIRFSHITNIKGDIIIGEDK